MSVLCPRYLVNTYWLLWYLAANSVMPPSHWALLAMALCSILSLRIFSRWGLTYMAPLQSFFLSAPISSTFSFLMWGSMHLIRLQISSFNSLVMPGLPEAWKTRRLVARVREQLILKSINSDSWVLSRFRCKSFLFRLMKVIMLFTIVILCSFFFLPSLLLSRSSFRSSFASYILSFCLKLSLVSSWASIVSTSSSMSSLSSASLDLVLRSASFWSSGVFSFLRKLL